MNTSTKHSSSIHTKRDNGVAIFEDSPIRFNKALLYRIGLPSNIAIPLALFGGSLRKELDSYSIRTKRAIVLNSSYILNMSCFPSNAATLGLVLFKPLVGYFELKMHYEKSQQRFFRRLFLPIRPSFQDGGVRFFG